VAHGGTPTIDDISRIRVSSTKPLMSLVRSVTIRLPDWMFVELDLQSVRRTDEERMSLAIEVARRNSEHGGGPFGAIVVDADTGTIAGVGSNLVVGHACSLLHAEIVAILVAQAGLKSYTLAGGNYELVTSSAPCVQCLGAVYWSGLKRMVCGAPLEAAEAAGFDEGPRSVDWKEQLAQRGVSVAEDVLADRAADVLMDYTRNGGVLYNARDRA
jgi:tRNA(Arg) A34 adenosine deaminase TadA